MKSPLMEWVCKAETVNENDFKKFSKIEIGVLCHK